MKGMVFGLAGAAVLLAAGAVTAPNAEATGTRLPSGESFAPKITLLSRSFRWQWDPFRVDGDHAYAVAWMTNKHDYGLTLRTYCKHNGRMLRALTGRHTIAAGQTFRWDTRRLVKKAGRDPKAVVTCKFWIDGSIDMRGRIVNQLPMRMGSQRNFYSMITFNYADFAPTRG